MDHRQKYWPEWSALAEFVVNNKVYLVMKVSLFIANYSRKLRIEMDIRKKGKDREGNRVCKKNEEILGES